MHLKHSGPAATRATRLHVQRTRRAGFRPARPKALGNLIAAWISACPETRKPSEERVCSCCKQRRLTPTALGERGKLDESVGRVTGERRINGGKQPRTERSNLLRRPRTLGVTLVVPVRHCSAREVQQSPGDRKRTKRCVQQASHRILTGYQP